MFNTHLQSNIRLINFLELYFHQTRRALEDKASRNSEAWKRCTLSSGDFFMNKNQQEYKLFAMTSHENGHLEIYIYRNEKHVIITAKFQHFEVK